MAIKSILFGLISSSLIAGCTLLGKKSRPIESVMPEKTTQAPVDQKAPSEGDIPLIEESHGTTSPQLEAITSPRSDRPKVGLILGPGGMKAFAHLGVLLELDRARIPIDSIVGLEWGAVVGALYAQKGQVHDVEWKLFKLKKDYLPGGGFFTKGIDAEPISKMSPFFTEVFGASSLGEGKIPFVCPSLSLWSGILVWQTRGSYDSALKRCLPFPPFFEPNGAWVAAPSSVAEAIEHLRKEGMNVIIFVNLLEKGELFKSQMISSEYESMILWTQIRREIAQNEKRADETAGVHGRKYGVLDFNARRELVQLGQRAGKDLVRRLVEKYGL